MRKLFLLGLFALGAATLSQQQADAWINFKFGVGLNWNWQSGGNNTLWGLFRNGQPPGNGPAFDPGACPPPACGNQGNPFGGFGGYGGMGMNMPGACPQMGGACFQQQPGMMLPTTAPQQQQNCPPSFPGYTPYKNDEFQYFGNQPAVPNNGPTDANRQNSLTAMTGYPQQYQYQAAYSPYGGASYYPSYPAPSYPDPYHYYGGYYPSYYSPYGR